MKEPLIEALLFFKKEVKKNESKQHKQNLINWFSINNIS